MLVSFERSAVPNETFSPSTFASLSNHWYRRLFISGSFTFLAVQGLVIARGWLATDITGSNAGLGAVYMFFGVASLVSSPLGGVVADRWSKRGLVTSTSVITGFSALWIGLGVQFGFIEYWMLLAASAAQGAAFSFLAPARMSMTAELVGRDLLANAVVLGQLSVNATRVVGPSLAGLGIGVAWFGITGVFYSATVLAMVAAGLSMTLPANLGRVPVSPLSHRAQLMEGLRHVNANREVRRLVLTSFFVVVLAFSHVAFLPRVATDMFGAGAAAYGLMAGVSAGGAVVASLFIAKRSTERELRIAQTVSGVMFGFSVFAIAFAPNLTVVLIVLVVVGASSAAFQAMNNALVLHLTSFEYHGRLQSMLMMAFSGFAIFSLPLGFLADYIGLRPTFALVGGATVIVMAVSTFSRHRQLKG